jgi:hypothetical protein
VAMRLGHLRNTPEEASRTYVRWTTGASQASPPPTTLGAPWERGYSLPRQSQHGRSCRTSSTLQHHSASAPATVTCSYIFRLAQMDSWLG